MDDIAVKIVFALLGTLLSILTAICIFLVKSAHSAIKELRAGQTEAQTKAAVAQSQMAELRTRLTDAADQNHRTSKDLGRLTAKIEKMWTILQLKNIIAKRASDELTENEG